MENKKPSEPLKPERWAKMEKEIQELKRSRSILSIGFLLLAVLYGVVILGIVLRINQISDTITLIVSFDEMIYQHLNSLSDSFLRILNDFEMLLSTLTKFL